MVNYLENNVNILKIKEMLWEVVKKLVLISKVILLFNQGDYKTLLDMDKK
jgi:hypothetical protein